MSLIKGNGDRTASGRWCGKTLGCLATGHCAQAGATPACQSIRQDSFEWQRQHLTTAARRLQVRTPTTSHQRHKVTPRFNHAHSSPELGFTQRTKSSTLSELVIRTFISTSVTWSMWISTPIRPIGVITDRKWTFLLIFNHFRYFQICLFSTSTPWWQRIGGARSSWRTQFNHIYTPKTQLQGLFWDLWSRPGIEPTTFASVILKWYWSFIIRALSNALVCSPWTKRMTLAFTLISFTF